MWIPNPVLEPHVCRTHAGKLTDNDPDASVGLLLSRDRAVVYYVEHVEKLFASPHTVEKKMLECARRDGEDTVIGFMQDPGSAGKGEAQAAARFLDGYNVRFAPTSGDKETRAKPVSAQAEAGNVKIVRGLWNDDFLRVLENFPAGKHDDEVDALSGAHEMLRVTHHPFQSEAVHTGHFNVFRGIDSALGSTRCGRSHGMWY